MGSSNLTQASLGIRQSPKYELNIALKDYDDVQFAKGEFEKLWKDSIPKKYKTLVYRFIHWRTIGTPRKKS